MKYFDSHCHLDLEPLSNEKEAVVERAAKADVVGMINIGTSLRGSARSVEIANMYPNIWATVGLHPQDVGEIISLSDTMEQLENLTANDQVVGIGEIGLDYYSAGTGTKGSVSVAEKKKQKELFITQLELANKLNLPVVVHIRDAWEDFFYIIENFKLKIGNYPKGVVHCFTGNKEHAKKILDIGFCVGFTGFITFDQPKFNHIREAVGVVPINKLLIETDAPFLAPEPHRGKTNEPAYVTCVAKKVAEIKNLTEREVAEKTLNNTYKLFNLT